MEIFMKHRLVFFCLCLAMGVLVSPAAGLSAEDGNAIVAKAERYHEGSFQFDATVTSYEGEEKKAENGYRVYSRGVDEALVEFRSPVTERGKSLLMLGEDLWIYLPRVRRPVRIPLQQRLLGDVANGDMTRTNFAHDYNSTLVGEEIVEGKLSFVLDLVAKSAKKTYNRIKFWVSKSDYRPVKAEFFAVSGRSLKTCIFGDFQNAAGSVRPMRRVFQDSINPKKRSILSFQNMVRKQLSPRMFSKEYMKTLE